MSIMTREERLRLIRAPISRGILATIGQGGIPGKTSAGNGERPSVPVLGRRHQPVGTRARKLGDGVGF